jgi:catechol 2,3-dioxygenase-like lactoylglutathione lyase family enzyme
MSVGLHAIGVIAKDMGKTLSFYRTLGLAIPEGVDEESNYEFETPGGVVLGLPGWRSLWRVRPYPHFVAPVGQSLNLQFQLG